MNLTKLPQELIFYRKESIDDYDIDSDSSVDAIIYNIIVRLPLSVPYGWNKEKVILTLFNDANFLSTIIIIDKRFNLHIHDWINFYNTQWGDSASVSVLFCMTDFYLSNTLGLPVYAQDASNELLNEYSRLHATDSNIDISLFKNSVRPYPPLSEEHFKLVDFNSELLRYNTFKGSVDWASITNNFEINDVIRIVTMLGTDKNNAIGVLNDIYRDINAHDNINEEQYSIFGILREHFISTGELVLSKKVLVDEYKRQKEFEDECSREQWESMLEKDFVEQKKQYEEEINKLKKQLVTNENVHDYIVEQESLLRQIADIKKKVKLLARENAALKKTHLEDNTPEKAFSATGNECFTKARMGLLIYTIASLTDGPTPTKNKLVPIISSIGGWEETSVNSEMKKAGFNQKDIDAVANVFETAMPKFASEIRKQIARRRKSKK